MDEVQQLIIWTAGVFDGEGSALIEKTGDHYYQIVVAVSNTDSRVTAPIMNRWGGHHRKDQDTPLRAGGRKRDQTAYFNRDEARKLLVDIIPHLRAKQNEALIVLKAIQSIPGEAMLKDTYRSKAPRGVSKLLEPFYIELQKLRQQSY